MMTRLATCFGIVAAVWWVPPAECRAEPAPSQLVSIAVDGRQRSYLVHLPTQYDQRRPLPLVLAFHGGGGNAARFEQWTGLSETANRERFIVVYPNGTGRGQRLTWNAGICCGQAMNNKVDDIRFVTAMLDDLEKRYRIDPRRIFATGMSNGAMITYRVAQELSQRVAAIAAIGATMGTTIEPARPVPVVHFHGTKDGHAAYRGGAGPHAITNTDFMAVNKCISWWVATNQCRPDPEVTWMPDQADDGMRVRRDRYVAGEAGAEVILYTIDGGGHTWPGRPAVAADAPRWLKDSRLIRGLGASTSDISANDLMWAFFQRHPLGQQAPQ